jgi:hypothetical protein
MEQQSQGWCESDATNRWFGLNEKKCAFLDVPEPEHETKMGGPTAHVISSGNDETLKFHTL